MGQITTQATQLVCDRCSRHIRKNAAPVRVRQVFSALVDGAAPAELEAAADNTELCGACSRTIQSAIDRIRAVKVSAR